MSWGMPSDKICEKLKKKDKQVRCATFLVPLPAVLRIRIRIRIHRIHMFLGLLDPDPDPSVRGMDPDLDHSITKQKK
jgi:hypothetical protein